MHQSFERMLLIPLQTGLLCLPTFFSNSTNPPLPQRSVFDIRCFWFFSSDNLLLKVLILEPSQELPLLFLPK
jgi:hypothetical protein